MGILERAIRPALDDLKPYGISDDPLAVRMLLAIALQESRLKHRRQIVGGKATGPAMGYWQFELGGGCLGVLEHRASRHVMAELCVAHHVEPTPSSLWRAIQYHDILAAIAARLLLYTLPLPLPVSSEMGWAQYIGAWRPGKPHEATWRACWETASEMTGVPA